MSKHISSIQLIIQTLRDARKKAGMTQAELGKLLGLPQAHISAMESGGVDIRASTLLDWARAVGGEVLVVPRALVPALRYLDSGASGAEPDDYSASLYETTELDDDSDVADDKL